MFDMPAVWQAADMRIKRVAQTADDPFRRLCHREAAQVVRRAGEHRAQKRGQRAPDKILPQKRAPAERFEKRSKKGRQRKGLLVQHRVDRQTKDLRREEVEDDGQRRACRRSREKQAEALCQREEHVRAASAGRAVFSLRLHGFGSSLLQSNARKGAKKHLCFHRCFCTAHRRGAARSDAHGTARRTVRHLCDKNCGADPPAHTHKSPVAEQIHTCHSVRLPSDSIISAAQARRNVMSV